MSGSRKNMMIAAVLAFGALRGLPAMAQECQPGTASCQYGTGYNYIYKVQVNGADSRLYVSVSGGAFASQHGCSKPSFAVSPYPMSDDRTKAWMQLATTSLVSRTPVYVHNNGCTPYGHLLMDVLQLQVDE